ncbi:MAG: hypothetical protein AAB227_10275 [Pseudomonadota bacterium]
MSASVFQVGLLSAGVIFLLGGAALAIFAARIASASRTARAEADIRLAASQELATEVKRLAEKVEASIQYRDTSIENAFMRHNDACAASMHQQMSAKGGHHDDDDDDHKKHHSAKGGHHDDDDDDHKKHHSGKGGHHDDDDDDHHKKHHALNGETPSFMARLFGRVH